jgi:hypothetical protein
MLLWRFPVLWRWRARRAIRPMVAEQQAAMEQLGRGPDDWLRWWRATGERELQCILMTAWDPIGVNDAPEAWDEYDDYVPGVAYRLRDARDFDDAATGVADYLNHVERDWMEELTDEHRRANGFPTGRGGPFSGHRGAPMRYRRWRSRATSLRSPAVLAFPRKRPTIADPLDPAPNVSAGDPQMEFRRTFWG